MIFAAFFASRKVKKNIAFLENNFLALKKIPQNSFPPLSKKNRRTLQKNKKYAPLVLRYEELLNAAIFLNSQIEKIENIEQSDFYIDENAANFFKQKIEQKIFPHVQKQKNFSDEIFLLHNEAFIAHHLKEKIFDNVNKKSLDLEQRRAVLCDAKNQLVVAGAGSGKTLTISGKVLWLLHSRLASPKEILLLSYSRDSARDLQEKIFAMLSSNFFGAPYGCETMQPLAPAEEKLKAPSAPLASLQNKITVKTFHALGLEILAAAQGKRRAVSDQFAAFVSNFFEEKISQDPKISRLLLDFIFLYPPKKSPSKKYECEGDIISDLKNANFTTLKDALAAMTKDSYNRRTAKSEFVKSREELVIANFLFANSIRYEYEKSYEHETATLERRQYTPDFFLTDYGIYIEHFGIDREGNAPQFSSEEEAAYKSGIEWKRKTHAAFGTVCIETYSYEFEEGIIFENLKNRLLEKGVQFNPLSKEKISSVVNAIIRGRDFSSLIKLAVTFLSLYKSQYENESGFLELEKSQFPNREEKNRAAIFFEIAKKVYSEYTFFLKSEDKIDFDDMILQAANSLEKIPREKFFYKYVIVDEFQDISQSRLLFLQKIISRSNAKLFAVGDDWQAIYRFSGCDVSIFLDFEKIFPAAVINKITATHRNSEELLKIAEPFVTKNPEQFKKNVRSKLHEESPVKIIFFEGEKSKAFLFSLFEIAKTCEDASVLVLARNRFDADAIASDEVLVLNYEKIVCKKFPKMKIDFKTVHQSKGLEAEHVILISGENATNGFPNKMEDDAILNLLLGKKSRFEFAEERRLFYVALTRTRHDIFILSDKNRTSIFVKEIESNAKIFYANDAKKNAASGLQNATNAAGNFQNANGIDAGEKISNANQNTNSAAATSPNSRGTNSANFQNEKIVQNCPWCKSGTLVLRKNPATQKYFFSCENFPYCKYFTHNIAAVKEGRRCPECGNFLTPRRGTYGNFYGCLSYPLCKGKEK